MLDQRCLFPYIFRAASMVKAKWQLTHVPLVPNICVNDLDGIGSSNGLSPVRRQVITWTNAGILLIGPLRRNCYKIFNEIKMYSFKKMHLKSSSGKWRPFRLGLNVLNNPDSVECCLATWKCKKSEKKTLNHWNVLQTHTSHDSNKAIFKSSSHTW